MIDAKRVKALWVLGYHFWWHLFKSLIPKKKQNQAEKFKGYFQKDWISAFHSEEIELVYNFENCTVCGLCPPACLPSAMSQGKFLGPEHLASSAGRSQPEYIYDLEDFLRCTLCAKCELFCPEEVKISELAWLMRRWIYRVAPEQIWSLFPQPKQNLDQFANPFGPEKEVSAKEVLMSEDTRGLEKAEAVLFLGCREMALGEPDKWVQLVQRCGVSAKLITRVCCGGFLEELGAEGLSPGLEKLLLANPQEVITVCPHCFYSLRKKLPKTIKLKFILEVIPENLRVNSEIARGPVVFHDPCFLGRRMGLTELPRNLLQKLGYELREFSQSREFSDCCGAGGGLFWFDPEMAVQLSEQKISEALQLGAGTILTECGLCKDLMQKALKGNKIEVKRITELFL